MRRTSWVVLLLSFSLALSSSLLAQKITGTITGVVTDPQGAVVSGAQVTVTNQGTGLSRVATTNSSGVYVVPDLTPGMYEVRVKAPSFKEFIAKNVTLDTSSTATINAALSVGAAGDQVTVEATTIQVETTNGAVGNVISGQEVRELPLNGNNFVSLTQLVPGVSALSSFNVVKKGLEGGVDFSVNGNNTTGNLFLVDGVNNNDVGSNRTILLYPSIQAIDEFKILRNSYGAEYGQASGAIISIVTRGGTNKFHGGVYYDGRNDALNAADFFTKRLAAGNSLLRPKDVVRRNDYGFNIGGPIVKDKLFFFESEEWNKEIRGSVRAGQVPTLQERSGDFTDITPATGNNCHPFPSQNGDGVTPFFGAGQPNIIGNGNGTTLSPFGLLYMANYPLPNLTNPVGCSNWAGNFGAPDPWREDNVRADWHITKTLTMMGRYTRDTWSQPYPSTLGYWGEDIWPSVEDEWAQPSSQATIKLTKLIGSTAVNDFQVSFAANAINVTRQGIGAQGGTFYQGPAGVAPTPANISLAGSTLDPNSFVQQLNALSLPYFPISQKALGINMGMPGFWAGGVTGITGAFGTTCTGCAAGEGGNVNIEGPWHNNEQLLILKDDFSKVFGAHTFKAGFIATNNQKNQRIQNESLGENGAYWSTTALPSWGGAATPQQYSSGNGVFDILNQGTLWGWGEKSTDPFLLIRWHDYEFYGADNWKIRRNLTLDYGVRWSFLRSAYNGNDQMGWWEPSLFDPNLTPVNSPCNGMLLTKVGMDLCAAAGLPGGTLGTNNRGLIPNKNDAIQPRLGLAWDVRGDGKTAIRAGFGTFYNRFMLNTVMAAPGNAPFVFNNPGSITSRAFDNAFRPDFSTGGVLGGAPTIGVKQESNIPMTIQYNLTIERELANNTKMELAYVANRGRHLQQFINANYISDPARRIQFANNAGTNNLTPYGKLTGWGNIPFGNFGANSNYDALQALFKTRIRVVDAQFAYTWSKSLSTTDITDSSGGQQQPNTLIDPLKPHGDYGPTIINRPHILVGSIVYNAPKLDGQNPFLRAAFGAWETSAILNYTSGPSLTVFAGSNGVPNGSLTGSGNYTNADRPNLVPNQSCRANSSDPAVWLNPAKFTLDHYAIGAAFPTSPRGVCLGPGFAQTDFSIRKNFKITERVNAKFSMDFFNLFNKTQFRADQIGTGLSGGTGTDCNAANIGLPVCAGYALNTEAWNPSLVSSTFGVASGDRGPRQIQYGLKVEF